MHHTEISCAKSGQTTFLCAPYGFSMREWHNGDGQIIPCTLNAFIPRWIFPCTLQYLYMYALQKYYKMSLL